MNSASWILAAERWLVPVLIGLAVAVCVVVWSYFRIGAPRMVRFGGTLLKLLGIAALLACLLEPMFVRQRAKPGANIVAIIADNSASMGLRGRNDIKTRGELLHHLLAGDDVLWRKRLAENFEVRGFIADSRLAATADFGDLRFDGRRSALGGALKAVAERHRGQPLAGVILLTDGVAADLDEFENEGLPPIYPVVIGSDEMARDIGIVSTSTTQAAFEDAPLTIQADVASSGFDGEEIVAQLFPAEPSATGAHKKPLYEQKLKPNAAGGKLVFRFQIRPEKTGTVFYRLRVAAANGSKDEATTANNETIVAADRERGPHRVLYVSGRPNWEYKFLRRALDGDDQLRLLGLIRIAKREAKFEFRGRVGESSNPLFRGFGNQSKEEIERYDQPVLIRTNTDDAFELGDGFPKTAEELYRYRAIIMDDIEAGFFTAEQMNLLQRFVSERGGGLLMLGGAESFAEGGFARTPIGDMLPVYLEKGPAKTDPGAYQLTLTREGWLQPWARLRTNEFDEKKRLAELPHFDTLNRVREIKPAAIVVATVHDGNATHPALATQRFGRGRTAALLIGDLWQSGLGDEARQKDLAKAWRQVVRWLVADVPERVELRAHFAQTDESVRLEVRVRDAQFQPLDNASATVKVEPLGEQQAIVVNADASTAEPGLFTATYIPRQSGGYRASVEVRDENGANVGAAETGWSTDLAAAEFRSLIPNRALMEAVARKTGGKVLSPDDLERFAHDLPQQRVPVTESWSQPLWHTPALFLFALACFVSEWGLRRWNGLA